MITANIKTENRLLQFKFLVATIIIAGGITPLVLYFLYYDWTALITPVEAKQMLRENKTNAMLVDVRSSEQFNAAHIAGAKHWSADQIMALRAKEQIPEEFRNKTLLMICKVGVSAGTVAKHLKGIGIENVRNVRGGMQGWLGSSDTADGGAFDKFESADGRQSLFPFHQSPLFEQLLAVVSGFGIKATYTLLSLIIAIVLWRSTSSDLAALRWAMIFFFIGENCCAINYLVFHDQSYFFEYLHSLGMLLSFGFVTYAVFEGFDSRILILSEHGRKCAALNLCRKCVKYENVSCGLKNTFLIIIPALIIIAAMPLCADWHNNSYNTMIVDTFYNYSHPLVYQQFEKLYCPIVAMVFLTASLVILIFKKNDPLPPDKIFFAAGSGPLGFGMFRTILDGIYNQNMVWFNFWEETTELRFIAGVCFVLWTFRRGLFEKAELQTVVKGNNSENRSGNIS
ncbi:MAG: rhodanese-like domain-containing protein [Bacteroidia bacterium]|nr:MAG: rhodanese-like domain-containing protein [Bacteroidia bacterium]